MSSSRSIAILVILMFSWAGTPNILAADDPAYDDPAYPICGHEQSMDYSSPGLAIANDALMPTTRPAPEKPAPEFAPPSKPADLVAESYSDRFIALGVAAALMAFAFSRKKLPQIPPKMTTVEPNASPSPHIRDLPAEPEAQESVATEPARLEPAAKPPVAVKPVIKEEVITGPAVTRNIVVPIDFSPNSRFAVRLALVWTHVHDRVKIVYACDLETAFPAENLTPVNLTDVHPAFQSLDEQTSVHWSRLPWVVVLPMAMEIVEQWAADEFEKLRQNLPITKREHMEFRFLQGDPVQKIVNYSEHIPADLMVLVAHKHSLTDRLISGSHADQLLHASRIPIIVVCEPFKFEPVPPQEILITTDYSSESLSVFLVLKDLIQGFNPRITVLTVETAYEHHRKASVMFEGLEKVFRSWGIPLRNVKIKARDVERGILDYVKIHKPQLIAMSSHGRMGFAELIHPSITKAILHDSGIPILVVHGQAMPTTKTVGSLSDFLRMITG